MCSLYAIVNENLEMQTRKKKYHSLNASYLKELNEENDHSSKANQIP